MNENVYAFATKTNAGIMKGCVRAASGEEANDKVTHFLGKQPENLSVMSSEAEMMIIADPTPAELPEEMRQRIVDILNELTDEEIILAAEMLDKLHREHRRA